MNWSQFAAAAPELTVLAEERFQKSGLIPLGTITADGSPHISPVEPLIVDHWLSQSHRIASSS